MVKMMTKHISLIIILLTQVVACQQLNTKTDSSPTSSSGYPPVTTTIASNEEEDEDIKVYEELPSKEQLLQDLAPSASTEESTSSDAVVYSPRGVAKPKAAKKKKSSSTEESTSSDAVVLESSRSVVKSKAAKKKKSSATRPCSRTIALPFSFPSNSVTLTSAGQQYLTGLAEVLSSDKLRDCYVQIESHTDTTGSSSFNKTLSQQRAEAIKTYLVNQLSLSPSRLRAVGYGENKPLKRFKPTSSKQRRVQIRLNRS